MLRGGFKFFNVFSTVSTHSKFQIFVYPFQRSNYGKIVSVRGEDVFGNLSPKKLQAPEGLYERDESEEKEERDEWNDVTEEEMPENRTMKLISKSVAALDYDGAMKHFNEFIASEQPNPFMYRLLFSCGAKLGKAKETFSLYQDLRKRGVAVHPAMYSSLLKACVNCEDSELALKIGKTIQKYIMKRNEKPNEAHVNGLLMVFAMHGDMKSAFNFLDYLDQMKFKMNIVVYNHILENCCSNQEYGLRIAVLLYHHLFYLKLTPNEYTFAVLARCIRNCSFGNSICTQNLFKIIFEGNNSKTMIKNKVRKSDLSLLSSNVSEELQSDNNFPTEGTQGRTGENDFDVGNEEGKELRGSTITETSVEEGETSTLTESDGKDYINEKTLCSINVLKPKPFNVNHINCEKLHTPANRLMMFGGLKGFLEVMSDFGVSPNIRLLSQLLHCLPETDEAEEELMRALKNFNIKPDPYFYNILINRMISRNKFEKLEEYLEFTRELKTGIDLFTIGSLARICDTKEKAVKCIELARSYRIRISSNVFEIFLKIGAQDPDSVSYLMEIADEEQIELNDRIKNLLNSIRKFHEPKAEKT